MPPEQNHILAGRRISGHAPSAERLHRCRTFRLGMMRKVHWHFTIPGKRIRGGQSEQFHQFGVQLLSQVCNKRAGREIPVKSKCGKGMKSSLAGDEFDLKSQISNLRFEIQNYSFCVSSSRLACFRWRRYSTTIGSTEITTMATTTRSKCLRMKVTLASL
jgi:hypothetical protein